MQVTLEVNGQEFKAARGEYLLEVLKENGIRIPTLCSMEGFSPTGACRLCVVEIDGEADLIPACSYRIEKPIRIKTHSSKVIQARRTIVELLVSGHPDDCLYCYQNQHCELKRLAHELNVRERKSGFKKPVFKSDRTSYALTHDPGKCVLCGRCIRICDSQKVSAIEFIGRGTELRVGTAGGRGLDHSDCIACGQCIQSCPTGSLSERTQLSELIVTLQENQHPVIAMIDPVVAISFAQELNFRPGKDLSGLLFSALRRIGFSKLYSGSEFVDAALIQTAQLWMERMNQGARQGLLSFCPAWTKYLEKLRPDLLPLVLPVARPAQLFGRLIRQLYPDAYIVLLSPCIAAKSERHEIHNTPGGKPYVDGVLSTRELVQLLQMYGINLEKLNPEVPDFWFSPDSMSGLLPGLSGGHLEGLARALSVLDPEQFPWQDKTSRLRSLKACRTDQPEGFKRAQQWVSCSSLAQSLELIDHQVNSELPVLYEIMACQGGCIHGGGQPGNSDEKSDRNRIKEILDSDRGIPGLMHQTAIKMMAETAKDDAWKLPGLEERKNHGFH